MEWMDLLKFITALILVVVTQIVFVGLPAFAGWMMGRWILKRGCSFQQKEFMAPAWFARLYLPLMVSAWAVASAVSWLSPGLLGDIDLPLWYLTASLAIGLVPTLLIGYWYNFIRKDGRGERDDRHLPAT